MLKNKAGLCYGALIKILIGKQPAKPLSIIRQVNTIMILSSSLLGMLIPGWGHILMGHWRIALFFQGSVCIAIAVVAGLRWLGFQESIYFLPLILCILHGTSAILAAYQKPKGNTCRTSSNLVWMLLFPALSMCILFIAFFARSLLFGIEIYHISSRSMMPTLLRGDYVLADQFFYKYQQPTDKDVVIFYLNTDSKSVRLKRIHPLPAHFTEKKLTHVYLLGDRSSDSFDGRYHGPVPTENITGKAVLIIFPADVFVGGNWKRMFAKL